MYNFDNIIKEIDIFNNLDDNWDGYGGIKVLDKIAVDTKCFIALLNTVLIERISDIYPNPNGTISIEWVNNSKEKISLEIGCYTYNYFIKYTDNDNDNDHKVYDSLNNIVEDFELINVELVKFYNI